MEGIIKFPNSTHKGTILIASLNISVPNGSTSHSSSSSSTPSNMTIVYTLTLDNIHLLLTPELKPKKLPPATATADQIDYEMANVLVYYPSDPSPKLMDYAIIRINKSSQQELENLLSLHTSFLSDLRDVLAIVDSTTGSVISTLESFDLTQIQQQLQMEGGKCDPVFVNPQLLQPPQSSLQPPAQPSRSLTPSPSSPPPANSMVIAAPSLTPYHQIQQPQPQQPLKPQNGIRQTADYAVSVSLKFSNTLSSSATRLAAYMQQKSQSVQPSMNPPLKIEASTKSKLQTAKQYAKHARSLSQKAVGVVAGAIGFVGKGITASLDKQGDAYYVISQGLVAWNNVGEGMDYSFKLLTEQAGDSAVEIVQKKYGMDAGDLARDFADLSGHLILIYYDARGLGRRAIIKKMSKNIVLNAVKQE